MRICQEHWDQLRAIIASKGLDQFVSKDGEEAVQRLKDGGVDSDPLIMANAMISFAAIESFGMGAMGDHCPLCLVKEAAGDDEAHDWLDGCTDAIYNRYKEEGKLGSIQ